jgi:hypothetical protein
MTFVFMFSYLSYIPAFFTNNPRQVENIIANMAKKIRQFSKIGYLE